MKKKSRRIEVPNMVKTFKTKRKTKHHYRQVTFKRLKDGMLLYAKKPSLYYDKLFRSKNYALVRELQENTINGETLDERKRRLNYE